MDAYKLGDYVEVWKMWAGGEEPQYGWFGGTYRFLCLDHPNSVCSMARKLHLARNFTEKGRPLCALLAVKFNQRWIKVRYQLGDIRRVTKDPKHPYAILP